jgi:thiosulfate reductase cytochrome b subunit
MPNAEAVAEVGVDVGVGELLDGAEAVIAENLEMHNVAAGTLTCFWFTFLLLSVIFDKNKTKFLPSPSPPQPINLKIILKALAASNINTST